MLAQIRFIKMARSEAVETYIKNQFENLLDIIPSRKAHFRVWVECLNSQNQPGKDLFRVAVEIEGVKKRHYFVEKKDENFYIAMNACVEAIKKIFRREKRIFRSHQRNSWRKALREGMLAS